MYVSVHHMSSRFTCSNTPILYIIQSHLCSIITIIIFFTFPCYLHVLICLLTQLRLESSVHFYIYTLNSYFSFLLPYFSGLPVLVTTSPWLTLSMANHITTWSNSEKSQVDPQWYTENQSYFSLNLFSYSLRYVFCILLLFSLPPFIYSFS